MSNNYGYFISGLLFLLSACSLQEEKPTETSVEVVFRAQQPTGSRVDEPGVPLPAIMVFKEEADKSFMLQTSQTASKEWSQDGSLFEKSLLLSPGTYRFLLASNFRGVDEPDTEKIIFSAKGESTPYEDCYFYYPLDEKGAIKAGKVPLYVDQPGDNDIDYGVGIDNKFSVKRTLTRLQGRIDCIVRRATKDAEGKIEPIEEGPDNVNAMNNALEKIKGITLTVKGVSSRCYLGGLTLSAPVESTFTMKASDAAFVFTPFSAEKFVAEFVDLQESDYRKFEHSAYCSGPFLLPPPVDAEGKGKVYADIQIDYTGGLQSKVLSDQVIVMSRNYASLITLWLLNEEIGAEVEVSSEGLEFNTLATGDDGFWN